MEYLSSFITPTLLFFIVVAVGYLLGKIKVCNISLDLSAILICAILIGFFISKFCPAVIDEEFNYALSLFSELGTALFVSVIGISSGACFGNGSAKKNILYFVLGAIIVFAGFGSAKIISHIDATFDKSLLLGIVSGALTSTPGLSSVCENADVISENAILGYGAAYLFGVIGVVIFVQCFNKAKTVTVTRSAPQNKTEQGGLMSLSVIGLVAVIGQLIGKLKIPLIELAFGSTGGILICGIIIGCILNKIPKFRNNITNTFATYRNFGLSMFFVGTGVSAGQKLNLALDIKCFIYGAIITISSILIGYVLCRMFFKGNIGKSMCVIAGGMTSTPAIGVIIKKNDDSIDLGAYSLSYLGALITITIGIKFLC